MKSVRRSDTAIVRHSFKRWITYGEMRRNSTVPVVPEAVFDLEGVNVMRTACPEIRRGRRLFDNPA